MHCMFIPVSAPTASCLLLLLRKSMKNAFVIALGLLLFRLFRFCAIELGVIVRCVRPFLKSCLHPFTPFSLCKWANECNTTYTPFIFSSLSLSHYLFLRLLLPPIIKQHRPLPYLILVDVCKVVLQDRKPSLAQKQVGREFIHPLPLTPPYFPSHSRSRTLTPSLLSTISSLYLLSLTRSFSYSTFFATPSIQSGSHSLPAKYAMSQLILHEEKKTAWLKPFYLSFS